MAFFIRNYYDERNDAFPQIKVTQLKNLPIRLLDLLNPLDRSIHNKIVSSVEKIIELNKQLPEAKTDHEKTLIQRQIDATDKQIDKLVYELYDLTPEEIAIVENNN